MAYKNSKLRLITFDGDCTLYSDGRDFDDDKLARYIALLLKNGVSVALVTAAGYAYDAPKYMGRLRGLLTYFKVLPSTLHSPACRGTQRLSLLAVARSRIRYLRKRPSVSGCWAASPIFCCVARRRQLKAAKWSMFSPHDPSCGSLCGRRMRCRGHHQCSALSNPRPAGDSRTECGHAAVGRGDVSAEHFTTSDGSRHR